MHKLYVLCFLSLFCAVFASNCRFQLGRVNNDILDIFNNNNNFSIKLTSEPSENVTLHISSGRVLVNPNTIVYDRTNWNITVSVYISFNFNYPLYNDEHFEIFLYTKSNDSNFNSTSYIAVTVAMSFYYNSLLVFYIFLIFFLLVIFTFLFSKLLIKSQFFSWNLLTNICTIILSSFELLCFIHVLIITVFSPVSSSKLILCVLICIVSLSYFSKIYYLMYYYFKKEFSLSDLFYGNTKKIAITFLLMVLLISNSFYCVIFSCFFLMKKENYTIKISQQKELFSILYSLSFWLSIVFSFPLVIFYSYLGEKYSNFFSFNNFLFLSLFSSFALFIMIFYRFLQKSSGDIIKKEVVDGDINISISSNNANIEIDLQKQISLKSTNSFEVKNSDMEIEIQRKYTRSSFDQLQKQISLKSTNSFDIQKQSSLKSTNSFDVKNSDMEIEIQRKYTRSSFDQLQKQSSLKSTNSFDIQKQSSLKSTNSFEVKNSDMEIEIQRKYTRSSFDQLQKQSSLKSTNSFEVKNSDMRIRKLTKYRDEMGDKNDNITDRISKEELISEIQNSVFKKDWDSDDFIPTYLLLFTSSDLGFFDLAKISLQELHVMFFCVVIMRENIDVVELLLKKSTASQILDNYGTFPTPFQIALLYFPKKEIISAFLSRISEIMNREVLRKINSVISEYIYKFSDLEALLDLFQDQMVYLLYYAVTKKNLRILNMLVERKFSLDSFFIQLDAPLMIAIQKKYFNMSEIMIRNNANINLFSNRLHILHYAAGCRGASHMVSLLIEFGAPIDITDEKNKTPLFYAIECKSKSNIRILIKKLANLEISDNEGNYPITLFAMKCFDDEILNYFLRYNVNLNRFIPNTGLHLIHYAAQYDTHKSLVRAILETQDVTDIVDRTSLHRTPLHYAMENGCIENVKILFGSRANGNISDNEGTTCIMLARQKNQTEIINYLNAISSPIFEEIIHTVPNLSVITFPSLDLDPSPQPPSLWDNFLDSVRSNEQMILTLDTSKVTLSRDQIRDIVAVLKERMLKFPTESKYCGLSKEEICTVTFSIRSKDFSLQRLSKQISTNVVLSDSQQKQIQPWYIRILFTLVSLIFVPFWLLLGLFDYIFEIRSSSAFSDAFHVIFSIHFKGFETYKLLFESRPITFTFFFIFSSFVYLFPLSIILLYPILNQQLYYLAFIGILVFIIFIPLIIMQIIVWKDKTMKYIDFPQAEITSLTFRNFLVIFSIILDFVQLCGLAIIQSRFHENAQVIFSVFDFSLLSLHFIDINAVFITTFLLSSIWLLISSYIFYSVYKQQPWLLNFFPKLNLIVSILSNTMFIIISSKLISVLDCTIIATNGEDTAFLDSSLNTDNDIIVCWRGNHIIMAIFGTFFLILFSHLTGIIGPFFFQSFKRSLEIHSIVAYVSIERMIKLTLAFINVLMSTDRFLFFKVFSNLVLNTMLCMIIIRFNPVDNIKVNLFKILCSALTVWASFCNIIAFLYENPEKNWFPFILLVVGWVILAIIFLSISLMEKGSLHFVNPQILIKLAQSKASNAKTINSRS